MRMPRSLTPDTVQIEDYLGEGSYGPVHGEPRELKWVAVEEKTRSYRTGGGQETVSSARVFARPEHVPLATESLITLPSGRKSRVMAVNHFKKAPAPEHYELVLE